MKSPKIRFKNAQGADFPDWSQDSLGSLCQMYQPATLSKQSLDESGPYAVYGANGIIGKHSQFNHAEAEVVVSCRGNCGSVQMTKPCSWINGNAMVVHPKDEKLLEKKFLNYLLSGQNFKSLTTGGAQPQITRGQLSNLSVFFPSCQEQQKIASFFSTLDQKIELNERKLEALEKLKKGVAQKILNKKIRFQKDDGTDFPDTVSCSLRDISAYSKCIVEKKNSLFIGNEQLISNFGGATLNFREVEKGNEFNSGDILFGNIRPYLKKVWLSNESGVASPDVLIFKATNAIPGYLKFILSSERFF